MESYVEEGYVDLDYVISITEGYVEDGYVDADYVSRTKKKDTL